MASVTHEALQLIVKKLDQILKLLKLGRRSNDREEKNEESISQDKFNTAMHNVMHWVNKKKEWYVKHVWNLVCLYNHIISNYNGIESNWSVVMCDKVSWCVIENYIENTQVVTGLTFPLYKSLQFFIIFSSQALEILGDT